MRPRLKRRKQKQGENRRQTTEIHKLATHKSKLHLFKIPEEPETPISLCCWSDNVSATQTFIYLCVSVVCALKQVKQAIINLQILQTRVDQEL